MIKQLAINLLSKNIQEYIRNKQWKKLKPIQVKAISHIINNSTNCIIVAPTASGKTEATLFPVLSKVNFNQFGVQVLYISPLKALINDQYIRIQELCNYSKTKATKWHGEIDKFLKSNLLANPKGIVLITPESIEAMFVHNHNKASRLFNSLKYIIIDEIHTFLGNERGTQLSSLLYRLQLIAKSKIITIGISATIGENADEAKKLLGDFSNTKVITTENTNKATINFKSFTEKIPDSDKLPQNLLHDLYNETINNKVLIFPNKRDRVEEVSVALKGISRRLKGHEHYYSHHSSIYKEERENIEFFAKNNTQDNFCITCTSTLELGIDIGSINKVIQIDSTRSASSLAQRIGRSGRRDKESNVVIYATDEWQLLQSMACWSLYKAGIIEPINTIKKPYDILFHQILSTVQQYKLYNQNQLVTDLSNNFAFKEIIQEDINIIINEAIKNNYLQKVQESLQISIEGEHIINAGGFYSMFQIEPNLAVIYEGRQIGQLDYSEHIEIGNKFFLASQIWEIQSIDLNKKQVFVVRALYGKKPKYSGTYGDVHYIVEELMLKILKGTQCFESLDRKSNLILNKLKNNFKEFNIKDFEHERPGIETDKEIVFSIFAGTKIDRSLEYLIKYANINGYVYFNENYGSCLGFSKQRISSFKELLDKLNIVFTSINKHLQEELQENKYLISLFKWIKYLPIEYQAEIIKERHFDFEGAINFINNIKIITPT